MKKTSRRDFLKTLSVGGAAVAAGAGCAKPQRNGHVPVQEFVEDGEGFSFVHLTDMHVRRQRKGGDGYRACVRSVNQLNPRPELALMGGDLAFDGLYTEKDEFEDQIYLYKEISDELKMPYYNCIGNHDVLGLNSRRKVPVDDPDIGKKFIMDRLGMEKDYYSFDHGGWHFAVLNCIYQVSEDHGPAYEARIGEEQLHWLAYDLGAANKPTICMTHIAGMSTADQINGNTGAKAIHSGKVVLDTEDLRHVMERHNVKALLQGHRHRAEDHRYNGIWYISSDAVSACWWSGEWNGRPYGYTVFHCKPDGQFTWELRTFDWETHLEPEDDLERERIREQEEFEAEQKKLAEMERQGIKEPAVN